MRMKAGLGARTRLALLGFLGVATLLLVYEHRAHVLTETGVLVGLLALCLVMHLFMHKSALHGQAGHGQNRKETEPHDPETTP